MKKKILFVTSQNDDFESGLTYATELAKMMDKDIAVLITPSKKSIMDKFDDLMTAVTFAEANEHDTACEIVKAHYQPSDPAFQDRIERLIKKCRHLEVNVSIYDVAFDIVTAIKTFLKQKAGIDMVLLGPGITNNGRVTPKELNRLVMTASRPIVTMSRQALAT